MLNVPASHCVMLLIFFERKFCVITPQHNTSNQVHYKTNSRIISRIIHLELVVRTIGLVCSSNYRADSSNYQLSVGPGRLIIQLSAWYFQVIVVRSALSCPRAAKSRATGLGAITGLTGSHPSYPSSNLRSSSMLEPPLSSAAAQTSPDLIVPR